MAQNYYIKVKSCETAPNAEPEYWSQQTVSATQKNLFYNQGNIGVGVPNPLGKLQVDGSVGIGTAFATTAPPVDGCIISGNVGIGVATPAHKLHVIGSTRIEGDLIVNGTQTVINTVAGTTERIEVTNDGTGPALRVTQTGAQPIADFCDDLSANVVVRIADGGNVGIGTTDPQAKLHVAGNVKITGSVIQSRRVSWLVRGNASSAGYYTISTVYSLLPSSHHQLGVTASTNLQITIPFTGYYTLHIDLETFVGANGSKRSLVQLYMTDGGTNYYPEIIDIYPEDAIVQYGSWSHILKLNAGTILSPFIHGASVAIPNYCNFSGHLLYEA